MKVSSANNYSMIAIIGAVFTGLYGLICSALNAISALIPKREDVRSLEFRVKQTVKNDSETIKKAVQIAEACKVAMGVAKAHQRKCKKIILDLKYWNRDFYKDLCNLPYAIQNAHNQITGLNQLPEDLTSADQICKCLVREAKEGDPVELRVAFFQKFII